MHTADLKQNMGDFIDCKKKKKLFILPVLVVW
jgi:hypothetical protein